MLTGNITSATAIPQEDLRRIATHFSELLGEEVSLAAQVDPALIGGAVVEIAGRLWDTSLRSRLATIGSRLKRAEDDEEDAGVAAMLGRLSSVSNEAITGTVGKVLSCADDIVWAEGLPGCMLNELIMFDNGAVGLALNLEADRVGIAMLSQEELVGEGMSARGTGRVLQVPVENLAGRTVDPLGRAIDGLGPIESRQYRLVENDAPAIIDRKPVKRPMSTGIMAIDGIVPIGRGQRELIIGDRQTGKTTIAIDAIINQKGSGTRCFYVAIGQKASTVRGVMEMLEEYGAMEYTTIICATASDPSPMQYIAPYAGCAMAEHVMNKGGDALIIYDDLSKHAVAYRALSLQLRRPPGREAYPGDVFYLHARLLERAAQLGEDRGGGSMTALPIIETLNSDISAYIPTNVISITDGQIVLDSEYFNSGVRPAVNVGLSVSRVGGAAQPSSLRKEAGQLRLNLAQYRELKVFAQFASDLDRSTKETLRFGEIITEALIQDQLEPISADLQAALLHIVTKKLVAIESRRMRPWKKAMIREMNEKYSYLLVEIASEGMVTESVSKSLAEIGAEVYQRVENEQMALQKSSQGDDAP